MLAADEIIANKSNGAAMPMPKNKKLRVFKIKSIIASVLANNAAMNAGLHGTTIAPKKKPYKNAVNKGLFVAGAAICGKYLPKSISNINNKLITANIPNAIGETMPITVVKDFCSIVVNISPSRNMNNITPAVTISPRRAIDIFFFP